MKHTMVLLLLMPSVALAQVRPAKFEEVKDCRSLGEITGRSMICSAGRSHSDAFEKAKAAGATHIVFTNGKCIPFAGHYAQAEIFDCNAKPSIAQQVGKPVGPLGLFLDLIPADKRAAVGRNTGAYVLAVADESPAFFANVLPGDVIVRVGTLDVQTPKDLAGAKPGDVLVLLRDGQEISVITK